MSRTNERHAPTSDRGARVALIFALVAERLSIHYEHQQWLSEAQGASLAAEWLARSGRSLPLADRKLLSALSDEMARETAATLSRAAGLHTVHEMMEALDPNHDSDIGRALMVECEALLDRGLANQQAAGLV